MPRTLRVLTVLPAVVSLASGAAVLLSNVLDPGYRAHFADPLWLVVVYLAFYVWVFWAFLRATPAAPWLGLAKALGAYVFLVFVAFVFLGRGAWNTANALTLTRDWWLGLRARAPLVGRLVTAVPVALLVFS